MSNRRSARNRHRPEPMPAPRLRRTMVEPQDFQVLIQLGAQVIPKVHVQALWTTAQETRAGVPAGVIAALAGGGAVVRAVGAAVARHAPPPKEGEDIRAVLPAWALDVLTTVGLIEPEAKPEAEKVEEPAGPVLDEQDLLERAESAGLVLATS